MTTLLPSLLALLGSSAPTPTAPAPERAWTFLIYAAVDNNAEVDGNFFNFLDGVRGAMADDAGMDVVLFIDRAEGYSTNARTLGEDFTDARLYQVRKAGCTRLAGGTAFPEITLESKFEPDSADPANVRKFVAFGKAQFPAKHTALMLYGHADGRAMCPDEKSRNEMGFAQLTSVATEAEAVDLMALELCNMGGIEIGYQWRPGNGGFSTKTLVAIPNAGPALEWERVFARIRANGAADGNGSATAAPASLSPQDFGRLIVEAGGAGRRERGQNHEAVCCFDLTKADAVKRAIDALAVALAKGDTKEAFEGLRGPGPDGFVLNYSHDRLGGAPFVDVYDLGRRTEACERLDAGIRAAGKAVAAAADDVVLASWGGEALRRFEAGKTGLCSTFPDGDAEVPGKFWGKKRLWSTCRWYSPLEVPGTYGRLAWCADGAKAGNGVVENWFELLDRWFDDTQGSPEGTNGYAP